MTGDISDSLREQLLAASARGGQLRIQGGGSKDFLGRQPKGELFWVSGHAGVVEYQPKELVISARCGTPLAEVEAELARHGQMLPFEPPHFGTTATLGGTIAAGLSGPRRPFAGSARDFVLGVRLLNGRGDIMRFGGVVMKNVAGYDISRLVTGSLGTLGVILEVSLKVLPLPARELTLVQEAAPEEAIRKMTVWSGQALPLSGACYDGARIFLRLSGTASAVEAAHQRLGGDRVEEGARFWTQVREQLHPYFGSDARPLWRVSVRPGTPPLTPDGEWFIDWAGALRWLSSDAPADEIRRMASEAGGHATLFRNGDRQGQIFHPLSPDLLSLHQRLKQAFDPDDLLNPGRMYPDI